MDCNDYIVWIFCMNVAYCICIDNPLYIYIK